MNSRLGASAALDEGAVEMSMDWLSDFLEWWTTQRVAAGSAIVGAGAAVTAATSGVRTLRQNRRDSRARNRPMVAAELRADSYARGTQSLIVRNYGPSIARNVNVTFDPKIPDPADQSGKMTPYLKERYAKPITVFTPGMELDNIYYSARAGSDGKFVNNEPTPDQLTVTIDYENDAGDKFTDVFPLDVRLIRNRTYTTSSTSPEAQMKVIATAAKTLADIAKRAERERHLQDDADEGITFATAHETREVLPGSEPETHRRLVNRLLRRKDND